MFQVSLFGNMYIISERQLSGCFTLGEEVGGTTANYDDAISACGIWGGHLLVLDTEDDLQYAVTTYG